MNTFELKLSQISVYELNINELFKAWKFMERDGLDFIQSQNKLNYLHSLCFVLIFQLKCPLIQHQD